MTATPMTGLVIEAIRNIVPERHRLLRLQVHHALRGVMDDFALARHDRHGSCDVAGGDAALDHLVDALEALGRQPYFLRLRRR